MSVAGVKIAKQSVVQTFSQWHHFFVVGDCPVHRRLFSSISGATTGFQQYLPLPQVETTKNVSRHRQGSLRGKLMLIENHWCKVKLARQEHKKNRLKYSQKYSATLSMS